MISRVRGIPKLLQFTPAQLKVGNSSLRSNFEHLFPQATKIIRCFSAGFDPNVEQQILKAKQEAKQMLHSQQTAASEGRLTTDQIMQRVIEIKSQEDLTQIVASSQKPFILFCLAKHCNISKQILPKLLDALSTQYQLWDLVLFDIDSSEQLTTMLKVAKTPTVLLIYGGGVIDGRLLVNRHCWACERRPINHIIQERPADSAKSHKVYATPAPFARINCKFGEERCSGSASKYQGPQSVLNPAAPNLTDGATLRGTVSPGPGTVRCRQASLRRVVQNTSGATAG